MKYELKYYYFPSCPFCQRVAQVIDDLKLKVDPRDIMADQADLEQLVKDTGRRTVPCLYINDKPMHESDDIIKWLKEHEKDLEKR